MKTNTLSADGFESTYALLLRSEESERGFFEGVAYFIFILSAIFSIWQLAQQPVAFPRGGGIHTSAATQSIDKSVRG